MESTINHLTPEGKESLNSELKQLTEVKRPELVAQLKRGREAEKLPENADFDDAEERLSIVDSTIRRIETILRHAIEISPAESNEETELTAELELLEGFRLPSLGEELRNLDTRTRIAKDWLRKHHDRLSSEKDELEREKSALEDTQGKFWRSAPRDYKKDAEYYARKRQIKLLRRRLKEIRTQLNPQRDLERERRGVQVEIANIESRIVHVRTRLDNKITREMASALQQELKELNEIRKPELAKKLTEARAQGDLKENADYHDAKERLGFLEGRVQDIEHILRNAIIVEYAAGSDEVQIGSTVILREDGEVEDEEYKIVGSAEANPRQRRISEKSPIGSALLGKRPGQTVKVETPDGITRLKIVAVR